MTLLIVYGVVAVGVSFLCSLLEACLLSIPGSYVETLQERGAPAGRLLRSMKENIDRPLAAILTLNTVAHTVGAAGVGAEAAALFGDKAVGIAGAIMTLLVLVVSEIIPKTLGAMHAKTIALPAALTIRGMIFMCWPLVVPLEWINRLVAGSRHESDFSRAELLATIRMGEASGALERRESKIVSNLMALSTIPVADVLTPRTVVFALQEDMTVQEAIAQHHPLRFSRIPVYADNPEQVSQYVTRHAIHEAHSAKRGERPLKELVQPLPVVPEHAMVGDTLDEFIKARHHVAVVVDEYGGMSGLVTLEDLLETLLGEEIVDETDAVADMQDLARRRMRRLHPLD